MSIVAITANARQYTARIEWTADGSMCPVATAARMHFAMVLRAQPDDIEGRGAVIPLVVVQMLGSPVAQLNRATVGHLQLASLAGGACRLPRLDPLGEALPLHRE